MSDNDFREVIDGEENKEPAASDNNLHTTEAESAEVVNTTADAQESDEKKDDEYEEICYICHRPEHIAGKMIKIPNSISICHDCMQRTFDSMNGTGFPMGDMMNMGSFNNMNLDKMPNISMINLSDLQNMMGGMPNSQKIRKKKPKRRESRRSIFMRSRLHIRSKRRWMSMWLDRNMQKSHVCSSLQSLQENCLRCAGRCGDREIQHAHDRTDRMW